MKYKNQKLEFFKDELKVLLVKLLSGNYKKSAETIFDHLAHTGVDTDLDKTLKTSPTFDEFLKNN
ncbi:MAG: hypothetical protein G01um101472_610 [Parcubacteria group bacterium Gr01-1014_72]|nr:MAG: hypothetical protein G01um101472_610 [Parcubacteria group bacterium Gr01-1014_72]